VPNGIIAGGGAHFVGTENDDVGGYAFQIQTPFAQDATTIEGTHSYIGGDRLLPGSAIYYFASATIAARPTVISTSGELCAANPGGGTPTDWQEFVTQSGTINSSADYLAKTAAGLSVLGNDTSCGQTMGDYTPALTVGTLNVASISSQSIVSPPTGTATSGTNYGSYTNLFGPQASYWNGSAAVTSTGLTWLNPGTGTNPALQQAFNIYPCPSVCSYLFEAPIAVTGLLQATHLGGNGSPAITIAAGAGAGTSPTIAIVAFSTDVSGYFTLTTGTSPTASAIVATLTFGTAYNFPGPKCSLWPDNAATTALTGVAQVNIFSADISTGGTTAAARAGSTALAAATPYRWGYTCTQ
jgi:hypothetical protein